MKNIAHFEYDGSNTVTAGFSFVFFVFLSESKLQLESTSGQSIVDCTVFTPVVIIAGIVTWNTHLPASPLPLVTSLLESTCLLRYPLCLCSLPRKTVVHSLLDIVQYLLSPLVSLWIHSCPFAELPLLILLTMNSSFLSVTFALFFK